MIIKPEQELKNKKQLLDTADLLLALKKEFYENHFGEEAELLDWALESAIMRLSLNTGHSFE